MSCQNILPVPSEAVQEDRVSIQTFHDGLSILASPESSCRSRFFPAEVAAQSPPRLLAQSADRELDWDSHLQMPKKASINTTALAFTAKSVSINNTEDLFVSCTFIREPSPVSYGNVKRKHQKIPPTFN